MKKKKLRLEPLIDLNRSLNSSDDPDLPRIEMCQTHLEPFQSPLGSKAVGMVLW